jgi:prophage tail gpP-like protein
MTLAIRKDGVDFGNFVSIEVGLNLETVASSFSFNATASEDELLPILESDYIEIIADDSFTILTGTVDKYSVNYNKDSHNIVVTGRSLLSDLVDSTVVGFQEYDKINFVQLCQNVIDDLKIDVKVINNAGVIKDFESVAAAETGQTAFEFLEPFARKRQVLLTTNGAADLVITRGSNILSNNSLQHLIDDNSNNINSATKEINIAPLYNKYIAQGNMNPIDFSEFNSVQDLVDQVGIAIDSEIREQKVYEFFVEQTSDADTLQKRAEWELSLRRARSFVYNCTLQGHSANGEVWKPNVLHHINDDFANINDILLCNKVIFKYDLKKGSTTELQFAQKNAYTLQAEKDKITQSEEF